MRIRTALVHGGQDYDPLTGAIGVPIYQSSTFRQEAVGKHKGYEYARTANPTRTALERLIAELEEGEVGLAFSSGMAALSTAFMLFSTGDQILVGEDVYGGTYRVLTACFSRLGLKSSFVDTTDPAAVAAAFTPQTKALLVESPSNPLLRVSDLAALAELCHARGAMLIVDNTFLTPYWQKPLTLGADLVLHSATKYLGGHSDLVAGLAVAREKEVGERLRFLQNAIGAVPGPQDAWLLLRGLRTLALRMEAHEANARAVAAWLAGHRRVVSVHYPGLPTHPQHALAARQAGGFGGMVSFDVGDAALAEAVAARTRIFLLAESLGGVESLICLPARMTHASLPPERRKALGISDSLLRLSVGIEDVEDLLEDLEQALEQ
ncbi:MAG: aminotransferase class I/II-fold pyridoxal phosphate-dependent enzyme [Bacillota bacterium]|nr:aminotransferase class I/II-fold pyridoxal phosphate-dependent enzyme [Bacillota bacterium]